MTKTAKTKTNPRTIPPGDGPGLKRLRASPRAEAIRKATIADQERPAGMARASPAAPKARRADPAAPKSAKGKGKAASKAASAPAAWLLLWNPKYYDPEREKAAFAAMGHAATAWRCSNYAAKDGDDVYLVHVGIGLVAQGIATGWTEDKSLKIDLKRMRGLGDGRPPLVALEQILAIPGQFWRARASGVAIKPAAAALRRLAEADR